MNDYGHPNSGYIKIKKKNKKSKFPSLILVIIVIAIIGGVILYRYNHQQSLNQNESLTANYSSNNQVTDRGNSAKNSASDNKDAYYGNDLQSVEDNQQDILMGTGIDDMSYWIVFHEGFRNGRLEMATFNANEDCRVIWNKNLRCSDQNGKCNQYYYNNGKWEKIGTYNILTDKALDIIACNVDVYDAEDNMVHSKSSLALNEIDFSSYVN